MNEEKVKKSRRQKESEQQGQSKGIGSAIEIRSALKTRGHQESSTEILTEHKSHGVLLSSAAEMHMSVSMCDQ